MTGQQKAESLKRHYGRHGAPEAKGLMGGRGYGPGRNMGMGPERLPRNIGTTTRCLLHYLNEDKPKMVLAFFCVILNTAATLVGFYMLRPVVNTFIAPLTGGPGDPAGLARILTVLVAVFVVGVFANYAQAKVMLTMVQNVLQKIRNDLFAGMQKLPVRFYDINSDSDLMSRFTNDVGIIGQMLSSMLVQLLSGALSITGTLFLMLYTNLVLTLVALAMIPVMMRAGGAVAGWSQKYLTVQQTSLGAVNGHIEEVITGQKVVKVFCREDKAREEFGILNRDLRYNQIRAQFSGGIMGLVMNGLSQISYSLTACVGGLLCVLRGLDVEGLTVFLNFSRQFSRPINEISMQVNNVFSTLVGAERISSMMDEEPGPTNTMDCVVPSPMVGYVVSHYVTFGYDPDKTILKDINLYAKPGQKIVSVGSTGAGKTTIINLLNRFHDIRSGIITIDGADIRRTSRDALRNNIVMVLQDTHLFTGTVRENIRYGRLDATDDEVVQAAKTASAHSFIARLPYGYDTMLEGDGANLSQGQKQPLSIARAAISKVPVLILDEATSSTDTRTERHTEHGMDRLMADRITFIITHWLSMVRSANVIMVLEYGEIMERGTHEELLEMKRQYYELHAGTKELD